MTEPSRRDLLRAGAVAFTAAALTAACSSDDPVADATIERETRTEDAGPGTSDDALLNTALSMEVLVLATYQAGSDLGMVQSDAVVEAVGVLQQHHVEHRDTLTAVVEAAGADPFTTANPVVKAGLVDPRLLAVTEERDFVRLAHELELLCAQLYVHVTTSVDATEVRSLAMSIGAAASRRATVLDLLGDLGNERRAIFPVVNPLPSDAVVPD